MATVIVDGGAGWYNAPDHLLLFGQINLAACAARRAKAAPLTGEEDDRFDREYDTCRMWAGHAQIHRW